MKLACKSFDMSSSHQGGWRKSTTSNNYKISPICKKTASIASKEGELKLTL